MSNLREQEAGPQPPRTIRSPLEITSHFKTLLQSRDQLIISFPDRAQSFQSFMVAVDNSSRQLWFDEMVPTEGDRYVSQGESFQIDAWHDGVHMRWRCPSAERVMFENAPAYRAALPDEMLYHQKRGAFRAPVQRPLETGVGLIHSKRGTSNTGHLLDISATGCKARLSGDHSSLKPGDLYEPSYLELPDIGRVGVAIEIRHVCYQAATDESLVGLRFRQAAPAAQRQIDRFVNLLQREARRLEKDDLF